MYHDMQDDTGHTLMKSNYSLIMGEGDVLKTKQKKKPEIVIIYNWII